MGRRSQVQAAVLAVALAATAAPTLAASLEGTTWQFPGTETRVTFLPTGRISFSDGDSGTWKAQGGSVQFDNGFTLYILERSGDAMSGTWERMSGEDKGKKYHSALALVGALGTPAAAAKDTAAAGGGPAGCPSGPPEPAAGEARRLMVQAEALADAAAYPEAIAKLEAAVAAAPKAAEARFNLAKVLAATKDYDAAIRQMRCYLGLAPKAPDRQDAQDEIERWDALAELSPQRLRAREEQATRALWAKHKGRVYYVAIPYKSGKAFCGMRGAVTTILDGEVVVAAGQWPAIPVDGPSASHFLKNAPEICRKQTDVREFHCDFGATVRVTLNSESEVQIELDDYMYPDSLWKNCDSRSETHFMYYREAQSRGIPWGAWNDIAAALAHAKDLYEKFVPKKLRCSR